MHAKIVIVDNKAAIIGSHNWSESALRYNHEASILTRDPDTIKETVRYFNKLREKR